MESVMLIPESFQSADGRKVTLRPGDLFRFFPEAKSFGLERASYPLCAVLFDGPKLEGRKAVRTWTDAHILPTIPNEDAGQVVEEIVRRHTRDLKPIPREGYANQWTLVLA